MRKKKIIKTEDIQLGLKTAKLMEVLKNKKDSLINRNKCINSKIKNIINRLKLQML